MRTSSFLCGFHAFSLALTYALSVFVQVAGARCPEDGLFCRASNGVRDRVWGGSLPVPGVPSMMMMMITIISLVSHPSCR